MGCKNHFGRLNPKLQAAYLLLTEPPITWIFIDFENHSPIRWIISSFHIPVRKSKLENYSFDLIMHLNFVRYSV